MLASLILGSTEQQRNPANAACGAPGRRSSTPRVSIDRPVHARIVETAREARGLLSAVEPESQPRAAATGAATGAPHVHNDRMASTASSSSAAPAPDDGLPDPRRLFPPVATAGLETLPSTHDVSGLEPAPPPPAPLQSPEKKKRPLLLFCSCT